MQSQFSSDVAKAFKVYVNKVVSDQQKVEALAKYEQRVYAPGPASALAANSPAWKARRLAEYKAAKLVEGSVDYVVNYEV